MPRTLLLLAAATWATSVAVEAAPADSKAGSTGHGAVPALYATRAEAEKAAKLHFHCTGAHPMGNQWMPCSAHSGSHH